MKKSEILQQVLTRLQMGENYYVCLALTNMRWDIYGMPNLHTGLPEVPPLELDPHKQLENWVHDLLSPYESLDFYVGNDILYKSAKRPRPKLCAISGEMSVQTEAFVPFTCSWAALAREVECINGMTPNQFRAAVTAHRIKWVQWMITYWQAVETAQPIPPPPPYQPT